MGEVDVRLHSLIRSSVECHSAVQCCIVREILCAPGQAAKCLATSGAASKSHTAWRNPDAGYFVAPHFTAPTDLRTPSWASRPKRRSRSELVTTLTEENPIAAPATTGFNMPSAASGIAAVL